MIKCNPVEMRKNLAAVEVLKDAGIDFVPIPAIDEADKERLILLLGSVLKGLTDE